MLRSLQLLNLDRAMTPENSRRGVLHAALGGLVAASLGCLRPKDSGSSTESTGLDATARLSLAKRVYKILDAECASCHGKSGSNSGGLNYVLEYDLLIDSKKVVPFDPQASLLLTRSDKGGMPPAKAMKPDDIDVIRSWIEQGAPSWNDEDLRDRVEWSYVLDAVDKDLQDQGDNAGRMRYVDFADVWNRGMPDKRMDTLRQALSKLINSVSTAAEIAVPLAIDERKLIYRIDLQQFGLDGAKWNGIAASYPYAVIHDSNEKFKSIVDKTGATTPIIRADWFAARVADPALYHFVLGLPGDLAGLASFAGGVELVDSLKGNKASVHRAGFYESGVSSSNRAMDRFESSSGAFWLSYDFASSTAKHNLFTNPLGPASLFTGTALVSNPLGDKSFVADGGEVIFHLPNGMLGYFLTTGAGVRLEDAPIAIVSNTDFGKKYVIVRNGFSCFQCHHGGMIEKTDEVRDAVLSETNYFTPAERETVRRVYADSGEMKKRYQEDTAKYQAALAKAGVTAKIDPIVESRSAYDASLNFSTVVRELRSETNRVRQILAEDQDFGPAFAVLTTGGLLKRELFETNFQKLIVKLADGRSVPAGAVVGVSPSSGSSGLATNGSVSVAVGSTPGGATSLTGPIERGLRMAGLVSPDVDYLIEVHQDGGAAVDGKTVAEGETVVFTPTEAFKGGQKFIAKFSARRKGTTERLAGGEILYDWSFTTGSAADTTPPALASTYPSPGENVFGALPGITVQFDEPLGRARTKLDVLRLEEDGGVSVEGFTQIGENSLTFLPTKTLVRGKTYRVKLGRDVFDLAANRLAEDKEWTFTFRENDGKPLDVVSVDPTADASGVGLLSGVLIKFSKPLDVDSVKGAIEIRDSKNASLAISINVSAETLTIKPASALRALERYTIKIRGTVRDQFTNKLTGDFESVFTTGSLLTKVPFPVIAKPTATAVQGRGNGGN